MVLLEVWMQAEYILEVSGLKELYSYRRIRTVGLVLKVLKWRRYLQMILNW